MRTPDALLSIFHGSEDLALLVQAATNTLKKRLDMASRALADFLNNMIFGHSGPVRQFAAALGADGGRAGTCLLEGIRCNYTKAFFPVSDGQAAGTPLVKGQYKAQLHFTIGMLRIFDAQENSTSGGTPYCDFFDRNQRYLRGGNLLCAYGPLFFPMLEAVLPKLSPIHWEYVQSVKTEDDVDVLLAKTFARQALKKAPSLLLPLFLLNFVQDCHQARRSSQRVYDTSNLPEAPRVAGLSTAQIALLVYCVLREKGRPENPYSFFAALRG